MTLLLRLSSTTLSHTLAYNYSTTHIFPCELFVKSFFLTVVYSLCLSFCRSTALKLPIGPWDSVSKRHLAVGALVGHDLPAAILKEEMGKPGLGGGGDWEEQEKEAGTPDRCMFFAGRLAEVRVWSVRRSQWEIMRDRYVLWELWGRREKVEKENRRRGGRGEQKGGGR